MGQCIRRLECIYVGKGKRTGYAGFYVGQCIGRVACM